MGFYVLITQVEETSDVVLYQYGPDERSTGFLSLRKADGVIENIQDPAVPNPQAFFIRACVKLQQHYRIGEYPIKTSWCS